MAAGHLYFEAGAVVVTLVLLGKQLVVRPGERLAAVAMQAAGITLMRPDPRRVAGAAMAFSSASVVADALTLRRWRASPSRRA